ncbi:MAG: hypothetical protein ACETWM_20485 [Candidatus Lokiarchaeia archaeon]
MYVCTVAKKSGLASSTNTAEREFNSFTYMRRRTTYLSPTLAEACPESVRATATRNRYTEGD